MNSTTAAGRKRVIRENTSKEFMQHHLDDSIEDIANHGADAGYPWLTYTVDTVRLFDRYGDEIREIARHEAEAMGCKNVAEFIAGFRREDMLETLDTTKNLLVWFAAETYARQIMEEREERTPYV